MRFSLGLIMGYRNKTLILMPIRALLIARVNSLKKYGITSKL